ETFRVIRRYPVGAADALSPDGRTAAVGTADGDLGLLDLASGRGRTLTGARAGDPMAVSPDGGAGGRRSRLEPRRASPLDRRERWQRGPVGRRGGGPDRNLRGPRGQRR